MKLDDALDSPNPAPLGRIVAMCMAAPPYQHNVTQSAKLLRIGRPALSTFLNGRARLSMPLAFQIERVYRIEAEAMLRYEASFQYRHWLETRVTELGPQIR